MNTTDPGDALTLADYRRRVAEIYSSVRAAEDPSKAWEAWRESRDRLFGSHPQSPIEDRPRFAGLRYFPYDPSRRVIGRVEPTAPASLTIAHSDEGSTAFRRVGRVVFTLDVGLQLDLYWLDSYGGGLFLPFRDWTNGVTTYGGGRYLLDTVKGADLGSDGDHVVLDFNFAYHPSCFHSPRWSCPLAPTGNQLQVEVAAGERV